MSLETVKWFYFLKKLRNIKEKLILLAEKTIGEIYAIYIKCEGVE